MKRWIEHIKENAYGGCLVGLVMFTAGIFVTSICDDMAVMQPGRLALSLIICLVAGILVFCLYNSRVNNTMFKGVSIVYLLGTMVPLLIFGIGILNKTVRNQIFAGIGALLVMWIVDYVCLCRGSKVLNVHTMFLSRVLLLDAGKQIRTPEEMSGFICEYAAENKMKIEIERDTLPLIVKLDGKRYQAEPDASYTVFGWEQNWVKLTELYEKKM